MAIKYPNTINGFFKYAKDNLTPNSTITMDENGAYYLKHIDGTTLGKFNPSNKELKIYYTKN